MYLKRLYDEDKLVRNTRKPDGTLPDPSRLEDAVLRVEPGAVRGVRILRAKDRQHFTPGFLDTGMKQGWLSMSQGKITIAGEDGSLVYKILRTPGYYCCWCDAECDDGPSARDHIETLHTGDSPDANNPAGYRRENHYTCDLVS